MVRRYHLAENDDHAHNDNDKNNTRKRSLDANIDNLVEPPSLQNEVEEYRRYGLEVARNIQNIMRGDCATSVHTTTTNHTNYYRSGPTKDLAINALVKYIQDEEDVYHVLDKVRTLAVDYIQQEHNAIKSTESNMHNQPPDYPSAKTDRIGSSVVHALVQKQRDVWLTLPQPVAAPWGLANYYITRNNNSQQDQNAQKRGEWTRDKLAAVFSTNVIPSPACKDALTPLLVRVLRDDTRFLHGRLRGVMCDGVVPDTAQGLVNNAMQSNILWLLNDVSWREWSKNQAAAAISQTFSRK